MYSQHRLLSATVSRLCCALLCTYSPHRPIVFTSLPMCLQRRMENIEGQELLTAELSETDSASGDQTICNTKDPLKVADPTYGLL